jgi:hypothetical protein
MPNVGIEPTAPTVEICTTWPLRRTRTCPAPGSNGVDNGSGDHQRRSIVCGSVNETLRPRSRAWA